MNTSNPNFENLPSTVLLDIYHKNTKYGL